MCTGLWRAKLKVQFWNFPRFVLQPGQEQAGGTANTKGPVRMFPPVLGSRTFLGSSSLTWKFPGSKDKNVPCLESQTLPWLFLQILRSKCQGALTNQHFLQELWLKVTRYKVTQEPCKSLPQQLMSCSGLLVSSNLSKPLMVPLPTL